MAQNLPQNVEVFLISNFFSESLRLENSIKQKLREAPDDKTRSEARFSGNLPNL